MITAQDANNLLALLNRVELKGNEAPTVVELQTKLAAIIKEATPVAEPTDEPSDTSAVPE